MLEASVLLVFVAGLLFCLIAGLPILLAILFGYLVFFAYGLSRGKRASRLLAASLAGIRSVKNILITFMLIGMLTAVWRACGTIATIICASTRVMRPDLMVMICFWLCCLISFLTGTSFGSAATMGVICMSISNVMGIPPVYAGGAILSGTFFGDRCSPMSTSAQLICAITGTDIYRNIRRMLQTCVVPFLLTSGLYLVLGLLSGAREAPADVIGIFERNYHLGWIPLIPALITVLFFSAAAQRQGHDAHQHSGGRRDLPLGSGDCSARAVLDLPAGFSGGRPRAGCFLQRGRRPLDAQRRRNRLYLLHLLGAF